MTDSEIILHPHGGASYVGPDAVELFRAVNLRGGLLMWHKHKMLLTRGLTITKLLAMTTRYTGQTYKRTEAARAMADLDVWIATMRSAIPISGDGA